MRNPVDLGAASSALTPDEAQAVAGVIANHLTLHETINIEERLSNLETALGDANTTSQPYIWSSDPPHWCAVQTN